MEISLPSSEDVDAFRSLRIDAVDWVPDPFAESIEEVKAKSRNDFAQMLDAHGRGDFVLGALDGKRKLVGMVGFYRESRGKLTHKGHIWGMYVTPTHRQQRVKTHSDIHRHLTQNDCGDAAIWDVWFRERADEK